MPRKAGNADEKNTFISGASAVSGAEYILANYCRASGMKKRISQFCVPQYRGWRSFIPKPGLKP